MRALVLCIAVTACSAHPADGAPDSGDPTNQTRSAVTMPSMSGDCTTLVNTDDGQVVDLDWSTLVFHAGNCSDGSNACMLVKSTLGEASPEVLWMISVPIELIGQPIDLAQPPSGFTFTLVIHNTTYGLLAASAGEIHGTLTLASFDPASGKARVVFASAAVSGDDAIYAFHGRCAISGAIDVNGFAATPLGSRCQKDNECGGALSGKVCDDASFNCAAGCHVDQDCPLGSLCDTSAKACVQNPGATPDEIAICQKACHDMAFFKCADDEPGCKSLCASEPRAKVRAFDDCTDGDVVGECPAAQACLAAL
jgi:hypothetical protein